MPTSAYNFIIGNSAGSNNYNGKLEQVSIFDYALSASQITTLWGGGTSVSNPMALPTPPKAYYPLGTSAWDGNFLAENNAIGDYVFDFASNNYIDLGTNPFSFTQNLTASFWVKTTQTASNSLIGKDVNASGKRNWMIMLYQNKVYFWTTPAGSVGTLNDIQSTVAGAVSDGKWHHIVCVNDYTNSTKQIYIDGNLDITNNEGAVISNSDAAVQIGRRSSGFQYDGEMSNVLFWDKALTATDVATLYNYGSPIRTLANIPQSSNLKAWYKLDASEIYNSSSTEWEVNQASSFWKNSVDFNLTNSSANRAYIQCANATNLNLTGAMTISAWMKGDILSSGSYNGLGTIGNSGSRGYGLLKAPGKAVFVIAHSATNDQLVQSPANTWRENEWNHVVGVFDPSSRCELYLNGVFSATGTAYAQQTSTNSFQIGNRGDSNPTHYYNWLGQLSNVSIWNTALSNGSASVGSVAGGEIATLYNGGEPLQNLLTGPQNSNLLSWWKLDNITTGIQDSKGTNNGTIVTAGDGSVSKFDQSVSTLNGLSLGMNQTNLVQSDLQTVAPYSKYAMKLDDATLSDYINVPNNSTLQITGNLTLSSWVRIDGSYISNGHLIAKQDSYVLKSHQSSLSNVPRFQVNDGSFHNLEGPSALSLDTWHHIAGVREGNSLKLYVNGALVASSTPTIGNLSVNTHPVQFNAYTSAYSSDLSLSNNAIWNVALNAAEIKEVYNEGLPSNLNTFSGTAPVSWWQLGENSSFDGSNWKYADEMTAGNNANSVNTAETALTNGVGTTANGTSSGMAVGALVGDAPYSTANAVSSGMSVVSRVTGSGNTP